MSSTDAPVQDSSQEYSCIHIKSLRGVPQGSSHGQQWLRRESKHFYRQQSLASVQRRFDHSAHQWANGVKVGRTSYMMQDIDIDMCNFSSLMGISSSSCVSKFP